MGTIQESFAVQAAKLFCSNDFAPNVGRARTTSQPLSRNVKWGNEAVIDLVMDSVIIMDNLTMVIGTISVSNLSLVPNNASASLEGAVSEADFDVYKYLSTIWGPQRQPAEKLIPLTIVYIGEAETERDSELGLEGLLKIHTTKRPQFLSLVGISPFAPSFTIMIYPPSTLASIRARCNAVRSLLLRSGSQQCFCS